MDWNKCLFCQKSSTSALVCPAESARSDVGAGYASAARNLEGFHDIGALPPGMSWNLLYDEAGLEASLFRNKARWHKVCRDRYNSTKLSRRLKHLDTTEPSQDTSSHAEDSSFAATALVCRWSSRMAAAASEERKATARVCFFCEKDDRPDDIRNVMTFEVDERVRACADQLQDDNLLRKLSGGDMIALEAKYHPSCLLALYHRVERLERLGNPSQARSNIAECNADSIAFAEVVSYIEDRRTSNNDSAVFKLSELSRLYSTAMDGLGKKDVSRLQTTRFKERLLKYFVDMSAVSHGRDILLTFSETLGRTLYKSIQDGSDMDAIHLMHAAKIVRRDILQKCENAQCFNGTFQPNCQQDSVPQSLLTFLRLVINNSSDVNSSNDMAAVSIAQITAFNTKRRGQSQNTTASSKSRHTIAQETPLPIYLGVMIHATTRKKKLVEKLNHLGLCISYDRVLHISTDIANTVCEQFNKDQLVCPPSLRAGLFTVAAADNIDHNPSSTTSQDSFHGTAISLMQYTTNDSQDQFQQNVKVLAKSTSLTMLPLPEKYTEVLPCFLPCKDPIIPDYPVDIKDIEQSATIRSRELQWLNLVKSHIDDSKPVQNVSWAAYHADECPDVMQPAPIIAMLPLFRHNANSAAMIRHSMMLVKDAVCHLNPDQIPVLTFDQPLFALAKQIQWHWPEDFGESQFVILMGGLHIEMAGLKAIGQLLTESGWVETIVLAGIASSGIAESFITASHVKRTRYAHIVTVAALHILQTRAYSVYLSNAELDNENKLSFEHFCERRCSECLQFRYWSMVLDLELLILTFVRSLRESNFQLYVLTLRQLLPWFFALDHTNYARWLTVHYRDMSQLENNHPAILKEFMNGHFTISKTKHRFSAIAIDQAHEQLNAAIKGDGGAVGIMENESALRRWTVAGPEIVRIIAEYDDTTQLMPDNLKHHEQTESVQKTYSADVNKFVDVMDEFGNPFCEDSTGDLISLGSGVVANIVVGKSVQNILKIGDDQFRQFVDERLVKKTVSLSAPLKRNKLPLFSFHPLKPKKGARLKLTEIKLDCNLFSRLYIACQSRDCDLDEFFCHENQSHPPSISSGGTLRLGTKSDLTTCLERYGETIMSPDPIVDVLVVDGAVIVQMLRPTSAGQTFLEYANDVFGRYILKLLHNVNRIDVVFDVYRPNSLKQATRDKRGNGVRRRVNAAASVPRNWQDFLRVDENKHELFLLLAETLTFREIPGKQIIATADESVFCCPPIDIGNIAPCSHEEADTRMFLHCRDATLHGAKRIGVKTVDTDVVVLAVALFQSLCIDELWIVFGAGRNQRYIPAHQISAALGLEKSKALPMFHSFTGCDTVSCFAGKGKKTAWDAWLAFPDVTAAFTTLYSYGDEIDKATSAVIERFIVIMYSRTSSAQDVNTARRQLFTKKSCPMEHLPPTTNAEFAPSACSVSGRTLLGSGSTKAASDH